MFNFILKSFICICIGSGSGWAGTRVPKVNRDTAAQSLLIYIAADNNLGPFAEFNVREMQKAPIPDNVNVLVQWDQPSNQKTWRYRILDGGKIDAGSLNVEMGANPGNELVSAFNWAQTNYPANRWSIIPWNHGYGIIDPRLKHLNKGKDSNVKISHTAKQLPWYLPPGMRTSASRGVLFDDSQGTYLTDQALTRSVNQIAGLLGKNIDFIGFDACFMQMIEVMFQLVDPNTLQPVVNVVVGSENTEPGNGWNYAGFLTDISNNPTGITTSAMGASAVSRYRSFYKGQDPSITQSAVDMTKINDIRTNIASVITLVRACRVADAAKTRTAVRVARRNSIEFELSDYIDLYSFYSALYTSFTKRGYDFDGDSWTDVKAKPKAKPSAKSAFTAAVNALKPALISGMSLIQSAVIANAVGSWFKNAKGIAIYYPSSGPLDPSYKDTLFAQNTQWDEFILESR